jgi:hypothetical protein
MKTYVQSNIQGQKLDPRCEINKHIFVFTYQLTNLCSSYIMMCIIFPITVCLLQNNERGFPLIFTITVVELLLKFTSRSIRFHSYGDVTRLQNWVRPMLGSQGLWVGRSLYRATPAVTRSLGFSGFIRRTTPFSRLLRHTRGCGESILTRIITGLDNGSVSPYWLDSTNRRRADKSDAVHW